MQSNLNLDDQGEVCQKVPQAKYDFLNSDDFGPSAGPQSIISETFSAQLRKSKCFASLGPSWALGPRSALCFSLLRSEGSTVIGFSCILEQDSQQEGDK